ncbi:MAG TPA: heparinase II/III family protein, partial [Gemmatimonadaceae bacterium]|nr:heparinase II/III family protein [Gemmatimonadaceae bacterium]
MRPAALLAAGRVLLATFGVRGLASRARFILRREAGRLRALPSPVSGAVGTAALPGAWPFRPDEARVRAATPRGQALERAERVARGEHQAYRHEWRPLPRTSHQWHVHPLSGVAYHRHAPWYHIRHFDASVGDIKDTWEPARFAWAYDLARGWMVAREERFAEAFWQSLEHFLEGCPPFKGVQWSCGQEAAIRALAWLWAEGAFLDAEASTPERLAALRRALAWSAERIDDAIDYALSQRNNHGISEAAGLVAIGARLLNADPRARRWLERGARLLEVQVKDQVAGDGWYIQHSFNYARVALDQLGLAQRALAAVGRSLSPDALERTRALAMLLASYADPASGVPPLHGANDGAYVLPLSTRPYRDFVPSLTAAAATFGVPLPRVMQADDETLAWLGAAPPEVVDAAPALATGESGWVLASVGSTRVFGRAGSYRARPGHIDALHVDVWLDGRRVATDAGTFRYAAPQPWNNGLAGEETHNTVT